MANEEMESLKKFKGENDLSNKIGNNVTNNAEEFLVIDGMEKKSMPMLHDVGKQGEKVIFEINICDNEQNNLADKPPQVIYKSSSKTKHRIPKKAKYYKQVINLKKSNKQSNRRRMNKKLEKFINEKVGILGKYNNQTVTESLSKIVSSCPMLKQVPAKESLLEDLNLDFENIDEYNGNHTPSLNSANSTISNLSQKTITLKSDMETFGSHNIPISATENIENNGDQNPSLSSANSIITNFRRKTITLKYDTETSEILNDSNLVIENIDESNGDHTPSLSSANSTISNFSQKTMTLKIDTESPESRNVNRDSVIFPVDQPIKQNLINVARAQVDYISSGARKSVDTLINKQDSTDNTDGRFIHRQSTPYSMTTNTFSHSSDQTPFSAPCEPNCATLVDEIKKVQLFIEDNNCYYHVQSETHYVNGGSDMIPTNQPIKPNVINIARAQVDNISFGAMKSFDTLIGEQDLNNNTDMEYIPRDATPYSTSIETLGHSSEQRAYFTSSEPSSVTLVEEDKKMQQFTENNNCFDQSDALSQPDITLRMKNLDTNEPSKTYSEVPSFKTKRSLMDTVNDLGMFPEITPQRSVHNFRDFIVAERLLTNVNPLVKEANEGHRTKYHQNNESNVKPIKGVVKSFDISKLEKLLNIAAMEEMSKLNEKCDTNTRIDKKPNGNPSSIADLWEKLAEALDLKVQKLEESLTSTILSEIKESFYILENFKQLFEAKKESKVIDIERNINKLFNKLDEDLQCNLMIEPVKPRSTEVALSSLYLKDTKGVQYKLDPSFEILKPPVKSAGDSQDYISIIVDKTVSSPEPQDYRRQPPFAAIRYFFKENFIVLAGAPVFLGTIVCIYFIIVLIVNWV